MKFSAVSVFLLLLLLLQWLPLLRCDGGYDDAPPTVCIVGSGIGGASVAYFLRNYSVSGDGARILMFERNGVVGGRMATVTIAGETFEAGASILHPNNYHARNFTEKFNLKIRSPSSSSSDDSSLGIWNGREFIFKTLRASFKSPLLNWIVSLMNDLYIFMRYGFSIFRMDAFIKDAVGNFLKYYESPETRPVFDTVEEMLKWSGLYNLTRRALLEELSDAQMSPLLANELISVITRINYGQNLLISGLAGAVSMAGSGGGLWAVEGGNWQMAAKLINHSDAMLHLNERIESISYLGKYYELNSTKGGSYICNVTVVATPLDEVDIQFSPPTSIPKGELQHTHATFVRGLLNPGYFRLKSVLDIPKLVGTVEDPEIPFSSISVLKRHDDNDMTYKIFSRKPMSDALLDDLFSVRKETVHIDWAAYPKYHAPEVFAPFVLDGNHLYYVNAFENGASTIEMSAVAAENMARLIISRFPTKRSSSTSISEGKSSSDTRSFHSEL
ncbi:PREDICTED: farnesylcysteine lyase isoform X2 [Tarenaya hassleriana]|uniref:farnesylcysteine lyase isoform X2 n=1 Tax=Tarenaya hassleriana TaxID=28532 RepID=UPI00053CA3B7|nr:PREDICTED: farnesylcysteine lyase isoform X2 [Tarenaya hassleriana]